MVSRMGATGRPRSNAVGVCRARASYQRAQQRRRQRAIGLKNAVEGQKDRLFDFACARRASQNHLFCAFNFPLLGAT